MLEADDWSSLTQLHPTAPCSTACVKPPALAGAVATDSTLADEDRICGRKKLPFAGYSVVKERRAVEARGRSPLERRFRGQLLSKLVARSLLRASLASRASVSLAGTFDCYIAFTEVQADVTIFFSCSLACQP